MKISEYDDYLLKSAEKQNEEKEITPEEQINNLLEELDHYKDWLKELQKLNENLRAQRNYLTDVLNENENLKLQIKKLEVANKETVKPIEINKNYVHIREKKNWHKYAVKNEKGLYMAGAGLRWVEELEKAELRTKDYQIEQCKRLWSCQNLWDLFKKLYVVEVKFVECEGKGDEIN